MCNASRSKMKGKVPLCSQKVQCGLQGKTSAQPHVLSSHKFKL